MPTAGLSLVGFMERQLAINHLKIACKPNNSDDAALIADWQSARIKKGAPIVNAGSPDIQDIPAAHSAHIQQIQSMPWVLAASQPPNGPFFGVTYKLVEIDPLLAFQFVVDMERVQHHCAALNKPPNLGELLPLCLPTAKPHGEFHHDLQDRSLIIKSRSLNLRLILWGIGPEDPQLPNRLAGINFGWAPHLVHVVRFNGKCYLHNGFHRAVGARLAGATHVPCVFRDVPDEKTAGIIGSGTTFAKDLLESPDPPTVAHFTQGRAHDVSLRRSTRILHLSWAEYGIYDE